MSSKLYCLLRVAHLVESPLSCPGHIAAPLFPHVHTQVETTDMFCFLLPSSALNPSHGSQEPPLPVSVLASGTSGKEAPVFREAGDAD